MASIKCRHCSKVYKTICEIIKHFSIYKLQQDTTCCIVSCNIFYKINGFLIAKIETMLLLVELINKKKSPYTDALEKKDLAFNKKDPAGMNKVAKMLNRNKDIEMLDVKHILFESKHTIFSRSKSEIQSI